MFTFILTVAIDYAIQAILVGTGLACLLMFRNQARLGSPGVVALVIVFAVLDLYFLPAALSLDATIQIGNPRVAQLLGADGPIPLETLASFDWTDLFIWVAESIIALVTAQLVLHRVRAAA